MNQLNIPNSIRWMLVGDLHDIVSANEQKRGGAPVDMNRCILFQNRVNRCNLLDLGCVSSKFS